jgi:hypothetical protein
LLEATSRYNQLMAKKQKTLNFGERREAARIYAMLSDALKVPKSEFEGLIEGMVMDALKAQADKAISQAAARFEVRRQIRSIRTK